ncbi:MAG: hypothetical protein HY908_27720 [Myxococcales bacterium]|nr:hypothetical protein [Myxococcales bacterium]
MEGRARIRSRPPAPTFELAKKPAARPSEPPQAPAAAEPATVPDAGATRALEAHDEDVAESERAAEPPPAPSAAARDAAPGHPATQAAPPTDAEVDAEAAPSGAVDSLGDTLQSEVLAPAARQARAASTPVPVRTAEAHEHHDEAPISSRSSAALESKLHRLDSEFFRESHAPHAPHHVHDEESVDERHPPPSPELLARRSRMRRTVGIVVGAVALVVVGALAKASLTSSSEPSPSATQPRPKTTQAAPASAAPAPTPTPTAVATAPAPSATDAASADASASAAPEASASAATSAEATASASSSASVKDLLAETLRLLNMNKLADAAESARRLVAAAPEDATGYLYLGSALQDLGKGAEARAAFDDCMTFAKTGPYGECAMMGGRKRK